MAVNYGRYIYLKYAKLETENIKSMTQMERIRLHIACQVIALTVAGLISFIDDKDGANYVLAVFAYMLVSTVLHGISAIEINEVI